MKLMDKYLLREHLLSLFYCIITFCMIQIISDLFANLSDFMKAETPFRLIGLYYVLQLAFTMEYLVPAALLLATLYTLWQLTRHNELTALRASGVSLYRIMFPFMCVGFVFALLTTALKEFVSPRANMWTKQFQKDKFEIKEKEASFVRMYYFHPEGRRVWDVEKFDVNTPESIRNLTLKTEREDGSALTIANVDRAEWLDQTWWFFDGTVRECNTNNVPTNAIPILISSQGEEQRHLTETPYDFANEKKPWEFLSYREMKSYIHSHPNLSDTDVARFKTDMHNKLAIPWTCLIVVLLGIPAGARSGRKSAIVGVFLAIGLFFAFYAFNQFGVILGKKQVIYPWLGAWLSNILFMIAGLLMILRMK